MAHVSDAGAHGFVVADVTLQIGHFALFLLDSQARTVFEGGHPAVVAAVFETTRPSIRMGYRLSPGIYATRALVEVGYRPKINSSGWGYKRRCH